MWLISGAQFSIFFFYNSLSLDQISTPDLSICEKCPITDLKKLRIWTLHTMFLASHVLKILNNAYLNSCLDR